MAELNYYRSFFFFFNFSFLFLLGKDWFYLFYNRKGAIGNDFFSNQQQQRLRCPYYAQPRPTWSTELTHRSKPCRSSPTRRQPPRCFPGTWAASAVSARASTCAPHCKRCRLTPHPKAHRSLGLDTHPQPSDPLSSPPVPISRTVSNNCHLKNKHRII